LRASLFEFPAKWDSETEVLSGGKFFYRFPREMISKVAGQNAVAFANGSIPAQLRDGMLNRSLLAALLEHLPQPVFVKNCQSQFLLVNAAFAELFRRSPEDFIGKTDAEFFAAEIAEVYRQDDLLAMEMGNAKKKIFSTFSGARVFRTPLFDEQGCVSGVVGIFEENAVEKNSGEYLGKSEEEFRRVWEDSLDGMRLTDESGTMLLVNDAFCRMVGMSQRELTGKPFSIIYEEKNQETIRAKHRERFIARDVQPQFERELLLWHGGKVWFELSNSFLEIPGQPAHLLSIFRDITERKIAEEKMHRFAAQLERSNRELQDFAYVASHDLQEPLRKVAVFSDRLKTKFGDALTEEGFDYIDRMQKATARMQTLISDLLSFSRVTSKSQPFVPVDLQQILSEVLVDLESRIEQVGGKIEAGPLPTIEAEPLHMRQLLQNLIGNALKFHRKDEKPIVKIEGTIVPDKFGAMGLDGKPRSVLQLTVSDNGIGFEEKYLEKIFQVFQRLHGREAYEGTGMGLAITRKIVEHHSGEITAKSKPGEGSTFIVTLPAKQRKLES
jgi:two-component system sensor kinase FixL